VFRRHLLLELLFESALSHGLRLVLQLLGVQNVRLLQVIICLPRLIDTLPFLQAQLSVKDVFEDNIFVADEHL